MKTGLLFLLGGLVMVAGTASAKDFKVSESNTIDFDTPSMNICCSYVPNKAEASLLSCSRVQPKYWTVILEDTGRMTVYKNPGEVPGCGYGQPIGNVLGYGETWKVRGYSCTSAKSGLTCTLNGKGFTLSRKGLKEIK